MTEFESWKVNIKLRNECQLKQGSYFSDLPQLAGLELIFTVYCKVEGEIQLQIVKWKLSDATSVECLLHYLIYQVL